MAKEIQPPMKRTSASNISSPGMGPTLARCTSSDRLDTGTRVDRDLAVVGERLNAEDPYVITAQPPPDGAGKGDVMTRLDIISR